MPAVINKPYFGIKQFSNYEEMQGWIGWVNQELQLDEIINITFISDRGGVFTIAYAGRLRENRAL